MNGGHAMFWPLLQVTICAALIGRAGYSLSQSAESLADAHGWGRGWVGLALLATVTSLPELASGVSAVTMIDAPNLAVGNALGACVINLLFLVVVDTLQRHQPMYRAASATHLLSAGFGVVMLGFVAMSLLIGARAPNVLHLGLYSPILLVMYLVTLQCVHRHEHQETSTSQRTRGPEHADRVTREWRRFTLCALVVLGAGSWLPSAADELARELGLSRSFVGTVMMAVITTLPEMAVTLGALRLGALDLAIGNLLGSSLFNVTILAVDDALYVRGPLLADVAAVHAGTAVTAMVMTGLVIVGLVLRPQGRLLRVMSWISVALVATYLVNAALVFLGGRDG